MAEAPAVADTTGGPVEQCLRPWFADFSPDIWAKLEAWAVLMRTWNSRINLISRKETEFLESRHLAPSLVITRRLRLMHGARILDLGTGGGLPGLPLAICYPHARFTLLDSIAKKTRVVEQIAHALDLKNVKVECRRAEHFNQRFDFVLGRAVTRLDAFLALARPLLVKGRKHSLPNGVLYWTGGDYEAGLQAAGIRQARCFPLQEVFPDDHLAGKCILHLDFTELAQQRPAAKPSGGTHY